MICGIVRRIDKHLIGAAYSTPTLDCKIAYGDKVCVCFVAALPATADTPKTKELDFAMKLLRLSNETIETMNRFRRGNEQRFVVQHQYVQVNEGGQAIVGSQLNNGGGVHPKSEESHGL